MSVVFEANTDRKKLGFRLRDEAVDKDNTYGPASSNLGRQGRVLIPGAVIKHFNLQSDSLAGKKFKLERGPGDDTIWYFEIEKSVK